MVVQTQEKQENKKESIAKNAILNTIIVSLPATAKSLHLVGNNAIYAYWKQSKLATISASGTCIEASILFDDGSQHSFITKNLADCLQLQTRIELNNLQLATFVFKPAKSENLMLQQFSF